MDSEQFQQFLKSNDEATGRAIKLHVNGKIDGMSIKLDNQSRRFDEHAQSDKEYQQKIDENITWVVRLIVGGIIIGIIGVILK